MENGERGEPQPYNLGSKIPMDGTFPTGQRCASKIHPVFQLLLRGSPSAVERRVGEEGTLGVW